MRRFGGLSALAALGALSAATYAGALSAAAWFGVGLLAAHPVVVAVLFVLYRGRVARERPHPADEEGARRRARLWVAVPRAGAADACLPFVRSLPLPLGWAGPACRRESVSLRAVGARARAPPRRRDPSADQPARRADDLPAGSPMALRPRGCAGAWVHRRLAPAAAPLRRRDGRDALTTTAAARRAADGRDHLRVVAARRLRGGPGGTCGGRHDPAHPPRAPPTADRIAGPRRGCARRCRAHEALPGSAPARLVAPRRLALPRGDRRDRRPRLSPVRRGARRRRARLPPRVPSEPRGPQYRSARAPHAPVRLHGRGRERRRDGTPVRSAGGDGRHHWTACWSGPSRPLAGEHARGLLLPAPRADRDAPVVRRVGRSVPLRAPVAGVALVQRCRHALVRGVCGRARAAPVVGLAPRVRPALRAAPGLRPAAGSSRARCPGAEAVMTAGGSWAILWQDALVLLYLVTLVGLLLYGSNAYVMVIAHRRYRRATREVPPLPDPLPYVTVQLPLFNERYF